MDWALRGCVPNQFLGLMRAGILIAAVQANHFIAVFMVLMVFGR
jgi:hypothetical protein